MTKSRYLPEIDGLRALAIVSVVLFHAGVPGFSGGFVGVDVFFVISGFLIGGQILEGLHEGRFSFATFYFRRVRRIAPAFLVMVLTIAVLTYFLLLPGDLVRFGKSMITTVFFASNLLFWQETGYFTPGAETTPLLHTWSLAIEEQFYIFFPWTVVALYSFSPRRIPLLLGVLAALSFLVSVWATSTRPVAAFYLAPSRGWELLLGAVLASTSRSGLFRFNSQEMLASTGVVLIVGSIFSFSTNALFPGPLALIPCLGTTLILLGISTGPTTVGAMLRFSPMVFVGLISYSLYLWHWPLLVLWRYQEIGKTSAVSTLLVLGIATLAAISSWYFIERPIRRAALVGQPRHTWLAVSIGALVVMSIGLIFLLGRGLPARLPILPAGEWVYGDKSAAESLGNADRQKCFVAATEHFESQPDLDQLCAIGRAKSLGATFLLWGDSHAEGARASLEQLARKYDVAGYFGGKSSCPALSGVEVMTGGSSKGCRAFNEAIFSALARRTEIRSVFLVARWPVYWFGTRYQNELGPTVLLQSDCCAGNAEVFQQGLSETIERLSALGILVYLVSDIPEVGFDVPRALVFAQWGRHALPKGPTLAAYLGRNQPILDLFEKLAGRANVNLIHPIKNLCSDKFCEIEDSGEPLYFDDNHISRAGARKVASVFEPTFVKAASVRGSIAPDGIK